MNDLRRSKAMFLAADIAWREAGVIEWRVR